MGKKVRKRRQDSNRRRTNIFQSWNVYNSANIARVKADEDAAAAREAAEEQRMQELDAERRAAILRGLTPPPLPEEAESKDSERKKYRDDRGRDRKQRKLAGEDDTDMAIRLAKAKAAPQGDDGEGARVLKLRNEKSDAPLTDHAGNIDLFPVDMKEAIKRQKNAEVEAEKRRKERALEDQYTMRFSNAAGKDGLNQTWYTAKPKPEEEVQDKSISRRNEELSAFEGKNVWGNEDPRRKEREKARIASNDPLAFMQQAQRQLERSKAAKKKIAAERERELKELKAAQEQEERKDRHHKRRHRDEYDRSTHARSHRADDESRSTRHKHHHHSRSLSPRRDRHGRGHKHRERDSRRSHSHRRRSRSPSRDRGRHTREHRDRDRDTRHSHSRSYRD